MGRTDNLHLQYKRCTSLDFRKVEGMEERMEGPVVVVLSLTDNFTYIYK